MRNPQGNLTVFTPDAPTMEQDTFTCYHCNTVKIINAAKRRDPLEGLFCRQCMQYICEQCAALGRCDPFEKKLERWERIARLRDVLSRG